MFQNFKLKKYSRPKRIFICLILCFIACAKEKKQQSKPDEKIKIEFIRSIPEGVTAPEGMIWVTGNQFKQGAVTEDTLAMNHEKPAHDVIVDGFFIDATEVTNAQFKKFVESTGYITLAEQEIDWEEMKKELPEGTLKPADSILQPGSLLFKSSDTELPHLYDYSQWWEWKIGANWKHPYGPDSTIEGKDDYPVVHIAYEDAVAYCQWANRRLPTEAEWELASRGSNLSTIYNWGNQDNLLAQKANTWEGSFPDTNTKEDGFERLAPVKSYPPNTLGIYDMAGNVWEWTQDWYNPAYYKILSETTIQKNPQGAEVAYDPNNPLAKEKIIKGGSYLCHKSYCASYRNSAKMANSISSSSEHVGFRTVLSVDMMDQ